MKGLLIKCQKKIEAELPLILIESNILPRLPAKSVGRCMCVCKRWKSFLSTPTFARMHLYHVTINDYKLLLLDGQTPATFRTCDHASKTTICHNPNLDPSAQSILASLDGLVCLTPRERSTRLAFWNPLTGAYKKLSSLFSYDFTKFNSDHDAIGFYINSSNDYRLVCLLLGGLGGAYIYSNRLDSWRKVKFSIFFRVRPMWSPATFWRNCLYFTVTCYHSHVIRFDVEKETFRIIKSPLGRRGAIIHFCASLYVLNGALHLCASYDTFGKLWRMDDNNEWVEVDVDGGLFYTRQHICATSSGDWLAVLEENQTSFKKMNTNHFISRYDNFCFPSWKYMSSRMMYAETLVSPNP